MWTHRPKDQAGAKFNRGAQLLRAELDRRGWSQTKLKSELGTDQSISYWLHGDRRPGLEGAIKLRDLLGIPVDAWVQPAQGAAEAAA